MEKFFNDIQTFISTMDSVLKFAIMALLITLDMLVFKSFLRTTNKDKFKFKLIYPLLFVLITGLLVLFAIYTF